MNTDHSELAAVLWELAIIAEANPDSPVYVGTEGAEKLRGAADALEALTTERAITDEDCAVALIAWRDKGYELAGVSPKPPYDEEKNPSLWRADSIAKMRAALTAYAAQNPEGDTRG